MLYGYDDAKVCVLSIVCVYVCVCPVVFECVCLPDFLACRGEKDEIAIVAAELDKLACKVDLPHLPSLKHTKHIITARAGRGRRGDHHR